MDNTPLNAVLKNKNLILHARTVIRATRSDTYFDNWDKFSAYWLCSLPLEQEIRMLVGADIGTATDQLFEREISSEGLLNIANELSLMTYPQEAETFLSTFNKSLDLVDASKVMYAAVTLQGTEYLGAKNQLLAQQWLEYWQANVKQQNIEQVQHRQAELVAETYMITCQEFSSCVFEYINKFQHTSTLLVTSLAAIAFTQNINFELISALIDAITPLLRLYRLIEDVAIDEGEILNAATYAYSSEHNLTLSSGNQLLYGNPTALAQTRARLTQLAIACLSTVQDESNNNISRYPKEIKKAIYAIVDALLVHGQKYLSTISP